MSGIIKKYNQFKESTYFAGGKFVIYATCVCLAATFAVGYLGLIIGFPLLTFPLAMLISNPIVWVLMGIILTVAYKMVVEPLFYLAKNYINGKGAGQGEQKTQDGDNGIVPGSEPDWLCCIATYERLTIARIISNLLKILFFCNQSDQI